MPDLSNWVRRAACPTDLAGGQCIGDDEVITNHTKDKGEYCNAPRPELTAGEDEVSAWRGAISKVEACMRRNGRQPVAPQDLARAGIRRTTAGRLRAARFAVIHTCTPKRGEEYGHVSVIWPDDNPLDQREAVWPAEVRAAFAACFTVVEE